MPYINGDDITGGESVGGKTGSVRAVFKDKDGREQYVQLKSSVKNSSLLRQIKSGGFDSENLGEFLACSVARQFNSELVPEVSLVLFKESSQVGIASRYINYSEQDLDKFSKEAYGTVIEKGKHVKIVNHAAAKGEHSVAGEVGERFRKDLAYNFAISALLGDHDVNPGNMLVFTDKTGNRIARIDFGHAFGDLLKYGLKPAKGSNRVMDFFNKERVGLQESKLWRDYEGLVPSKELAHAFREIAEKNKSALKGGLTSAFRDLNDVIYELRKTKDGDKAIDHIVKSLVEINNNISDKKITEADYKVGAAQNLIESDPRLLVLARIQTNLKAYIQDNVRHMSQAAELMELQLYFKDFARYQQGLQTLDKEFDPKVHQEKVKLYEKLEKELGVKDKDGVVRVEWFKEEKNKEAFRGNLKEFIDKETKALEGKEVEVKKPTKTPPPLPPKEAITLKGLVKDLVSGFSGKRESKVLEEASNVEKRSRQNSKTNIHETGSFRQTVRPRSDSKGPPPIAR